MTAALILVERNSSYRANVTGSWHLLVKWDRSLNEPVRAINYSTLSINTVGREQLDFARMQLRGEGKHWYATYRKRGGTTWHVLRADFVDHETRHDVSSIGSWVLDPHTLLFVYHAGIIYPGIVRCLEVRISQVSVCRRGMNGILCTCPYCPSITEHIRRC